MRRDVRAIESQEPRMMVRVMTKAYPGESYPIVPNPSLPCVLPVVYVQERWSVDGSGTLSDSVQYNDTDDRRMDLCWFAGYQAENTVTTAFRTNNHLVGIPVVGFYSVRSYDYDGNTIWSADYFDGHAGTIPSGRLSVDVDSAGNVYVGGPTCTDLYGNSWSIISYNSTGAVRWKKDIRKILRDVGWTHFSGNVIDLKVMPGDKITAVCEERDPSFPTPPIRWTLFSFNPDATTATNPTLNYVPNKIPTGLVRVGSSLSTVPVIDFGTAAACARGSNYLYDFGLNIYSLGILNWFRPTLVEIPPWLDLRSFPSLVTWNYYGAYDGQPTPGASLSTVCASDDGSQVYCSGSGLQGRVGGVTYALTIGRLIPDIPGSFPGPPGTMGSAPDSFIWTKNTSLQTASICLDHGVVMGGAAAQPHIQYYHEDDGHKVWAHQHMVMSRFAKTSDRLYAVGLRSSTNGDQSFV